MTYKGTIDEDKQLVLSRPLSDMDKKLIRVAYLNPDLRYATLKIVADDATNRLKEFAGDRKWKNPETSNLIGLDRVMELATQDKMWAKAILKKVTEEYKKQEGTGGGDTKIQNKVVKKLKGEVESEIKKFKGAGKDITNPKDRAEFEAYLDEKLRPAQEEVYREKIKNATGLVDEEFKKASEGLLGTGVKKALSKTFADLGLDKLADVFKPSAPKDISAKEIAGVGLFAQIASSVGGLLGGGSAVAPVGVAATSTGGILGSIVSGATALVASPFVIGAGLALSYKVYQNYKNTPESEKRAKLKEEFNKKKEELVKKLERERKYEDIGKEEATNEGLKDFFKDETFDDDILGDDLTIKELLDISQEGDIEEKERAKKILEEKKKEYMGAKYTREKLLIQESKGKKFKTPDGKRITVKEMIDMEEEGDSWASNKLKDLRHTIEGPEELGEEESEKEKEDRILRQRGQLDMSTIQDMSQSDLERDLALMSLDQVNDVQEDLMKQTKKKKEPKAPINRKKKTTTKSDSGISSEDAKTVLEAISKIRKEQESMEDKYKNETWENPDGKIIKFNTLKKIFGDSTHKHHDWAVSEWKELKSKINKKGADQEEEINKIVKDKFESALTVDPSIIELFKSVSTDGKFDDGKLEEIMKGVSELGKLLNSEESTKKKASLSRESLIKLAYYNPDKRSQILKLLLK
jgi:hypothetical protein